MYYGIDLGTTTTLVAEPIVKGSSFDARALKISQLNKQGNQIEREILPSYAYFPEGTDPVVGTYAKEAPDVSKTVRAIKRFMGRDIERRAQTPSATSLGDNVAWGKFIRS